MTNAKQARLWDRTLSQQKTKLTLVNLTLTDRPVFVHLPVDQSGKAYCSDDLLKSDCYNTFNIPHFTTGAK